MSKSFSSFVAFRYSLPTRGAGMSGFLSLVSLLGLSLGVFALIVVVSVMNGFERELQGRLLSLLPHTKVILASDSVNNNKQSQQTIIELIDQQKNINGSSPYVESTVMLSANQRFRSANMTGIDYQREQSVSVLHQHIIAGDITRLAETKYGIVIGSILARQLAVMPGDKITMIMPKVNITPLGPVTREKRFEIVAVFEVGADLDQNLIMINLATSQKLMGLGESINGIRLAVDDQFKSVSISNNLLSELQDHDSVYQDLSLVDWRQSNASLFRAVMMEKIMIFILLMSVVAVASFNIVSIILMTVTNKRSDIAVLRTMGASASDIRRLFILQGLIIGCIGTFSGALLAVFVAPNVGALLKKVEQFSGWQLFDPTVYFIPYLPSELRGSDVAIVIGAALFISLLATLYPADKASKIEPAEALAYEH